MVSIEDTFFQPPRVNHHILKYYQQNMSIFILDCWLKYCLENTQRTNQHEVALIPMAMLRNVLPE